MTTTVFRGHPDGGPHAEHCSFCGKTPPEYAKIFKANGVGICNHCLSLIADLPLSKYIRPPSHDHFACSFCGQRQGEGAALVAGPKVFICHTCSSGFLARC